MEELKDLLNKPENGYTKLTAEQKAKYEEASDAFGKDERVINVYSLLISMTVTITSISILLASVT